MAITVARNLRPTIESKPGFPCVTAAALTAPGPVVVSTTQDNPARQIKVQKHTGTVGAPYVGMSIKDKVAEGENPAPLSDVIIEGFAGVTPGSRVYVAPADGTLTHTKDASQATLDAIGIGVRTDSIYFYPLK